MFKKEQKQKTKEIAQIKNFFDEFENLKSKIEDASESKDSNTRERKSLLHEIKFERDH